MISNQIQQVIFQQQIDCILITDKKSIEYLINFNFFCGERFIGLIINAKGEMKLILNKIFDNQKLAVETVIYYDHQDLTKIIEKNLSGHTVGVDKEMQAKFLLPLIESGKFNYRLNYVVDYMRSIKNVEEVNKMRTASLMNDELMGEVKQFIRSGISEKEIAHYIIERARSLKNRNISFDPIVAFGERAADPHAEPGERTLKDNETVLIDMGLKYDGYCSDMTRVFFNGDSIYNDIYNIVLDANLAAIEMIKPGVKFSEIDAAARSVIEDAGYGEYFTHRLGHGIGKEVHEPFDVSGSCDIVVEEGMCFSIEPGIYIKDKIGIRIEDIVLVTSDGVEVLNNYPKEIIRL